MAKKSWLADAMRGPIGDASVAALDAAAVPDSDTGREQIAYIPRTSLVADEKNFYSVEDIDDLAANIETVGLLDPLRVRPVEGEEGLYRIVSGHRRRAALDKLALDGNMSFEQVPVIIETADVSPAMQELRLIYANSSTRDLTSADLAKQAERVTELLYRLKEEGFEFPGRMRDHVAEACQISKTKYANLKVINDNLLPKWKELWEKGTLNDACALTLARMARKRQRLFFTRYESDDHFRFAEWGLKEYSVTLDEIDNLECAKRYGGGACENREKMYDAALHHDAWHHSCRHCCSDCSELLRCKYACPRLADEIAKRKLDAKAVRQAAKDATRDEDAAKGAKLTKLWNRAHELREASGMSVELFYKMAHGQDWLSGVKDIERLDGGTKKITAKDDTPFGYLFPLKNIDGLIAFADRLGISLDYLFCRTDEPQGAPKMDTTDARPAGEQRNGTPTDRADDARPQWRTGVPEREGRYWCKFELEGKSLCRQAQWNDMLRCWEHAPGGMSIQLDCVAWYPLPEDAE